MVEFAIVLPVVLLVMLGVAELGQAIVSYNTLTKAVRDGARHASAYAWVGSPGTIEIQDWLENEVSNLVVYGNTLGTGSPLLEGLSTEQISVTADGALQVRIDAAYPYSPMFGTLPSFGYGSSTNLSFTMQASVRMRGL